MKKKDMLSYYLGRAIGLETVEGRVYLAILKEFDRDFIRLNPAQAHYSFLGREDKSFNEWETMIVETNRAHQDLYGLEVIINRNQVRHLMHYSYMKKERLRK